MTALPARPDMTTPDGGSAEPPAPVPHRVLTALLTLAVPAALALVVVAVAAAWADDLPDLVAVHFRPEGPDGFGTVSSLVGWTVGGIALAALVSWALGTFLGRTGMIRRIAAGLGVGMSVFLGGGSLGLLAIQRGLSDPSLVGDVDPIITAAMLAGVAVGALAAWAVPPDPYRVTTRPPPADAPSLPLAPGERIAWVRTAGSHAALGIAVGVAALLLVLALALRTASLVAPLVLVPVLVVALTQVVVTVDVRGLTVRSRLGGPRLSVPLDEVVRADVTVVAPLREFGGWGYRTTLDGRVGVVLRAGEALEVERTGGRRLVVTVDDAGTAAALLNARAARSRIA